MHKSLPKHGWDPAVLWSMGWDGFANAGEELWPRCRPQEITAAAGGLEEKEIKGFLLLSELSFAAVLWTKKRRNLHVFSKSVTSVQKNNWSNLKVREHVGQTDEHCGQFIGVDASGGHRTDKAGNPTSAWGSRLLF